MIEKVYLDREAVSLFLEICKDVHPRENIMLIRGKVKGNYAEVTEFLIPPFSTYGEGFSGFPIHMIPFDLTIIGIAHSHPSGNNAPSTEDLNNFYGRIMMIVAYPYDESNLAVYNSKAQKVPHEIK
ncbi:MAG: Mov34/MPN/PAD-1 family protein [Candidatus Methanomethyliaceae archaeon]|nr:Mov34/MPN/PAD-1 family protein [Candidatus Methanomethyliaceae archaeon]